MDLSQSWYVGDAAGRAKAWDGNAKTKKDFSCGDRKFAHNIGLKFGTDMSYYVIPMSHVYNTTGVRCLLNVQVLV